MAWHWKPAIDQLAIIRDRLLKQLNTIESFNAYPDKAFKTVTHLAAFETESIRVAIHN